MAHASEVYQIAYRRSRCWREVREEFIEEEGTYIVCPSNPIADGVYPEANK